MIAQNNNQLTLWTFGTPDAALSKFVLQTTKRKNPADDTSAVVTQSVALQKRKDIAKEYGLNPRKDSAILDRRMRDLSDKLKTSLAKEVTGLTGSKDWTGLKLTYRQTKAGRKAVFEFMEVGNGDVETLEQATKIMVDKGMTDEEILAAVKSARANAQPTIDTTAIPEPAPELPLDQNTAPEAKPEPTEEEEIMAALKADEAAALAEAKIEATETVTA